MRRGDFMFITTGLEFIAVLLLINAAVFWVSKKWPLKIYKYVPPVIFIFLLVVFCNTFGVWSFDNPAISGTRTTIINYMVPFMVFCISIQCDFQKMIKIGPKLLLTFLLTCVTVCVGVIAAFKLFSPVLGFEQPAESFGIYTAAYTGGIENLYAVASAVNISDGDLANVLLIINLLFRPWMTVLILMVPLATAFNKWSKGDPKEIDVIAARLESGKAAQIMPASTDLFIIAGCGLGLVAACLKAGTGLEALVPAIPAQVWLYILVTFIGVFLGTKTKLGKTPGIELVGASLATFALSINCANVDLKTFANGAFFLLAGLTVHIIHAVLMCLIGKLMKLDLCTLGINSIAAIGGVSSAPVVAACYGESYQPVSVIIAAIGSMLGTFIGLGMVNILHLLM